MTLTFTQSSDQSFGGVPAYEAEFEVTSNFAIHIERTRGDAALILKQRTGGGKYALVDDFNYAKSKGEVLDYEASVTIPKFIKIVSEVEPTLAEIVTDDEVTEIKAQAKEIEVTTNGTTEVIPDSGFAYLSKVNIKTNVPQSGEGEGGGSAMEYFAYDKNNLALSLLRIFSAIQKGQIVVEAENINELCILPGIVASTIGNMADSFTLIAIAIDWSQRARNPIAGSSVVPLLDFIIETSNGAVTKEDIAALPRITEEEFYNINA